MQDSTERVIRKLNIATTATSHHGMFLLDHLFNPYVLNRTVSQPYVPQALLPEYYYHITPNIIAPAALLDCPSDSAAFRPPWSKGIWAENRLQVSATVREPRALKGVDRLAPSSIEERGSGCHVRELGLKVSNARMRVRWTKRKLMQLLCLPRSGCGLQLTR
ncbi:hypothetical protein EYC80_009004 [Monilinia laxa]|uniref:Uncharacterized protein n=1 Tax=Monilinia laxa TaxID=61186 RepID=A0A5N6K2G4_MONLA|nr:hypothetical protein EYC80_009004 [Monilinia laxa]